MKTCKLEHSNTKFWLVLLILLQWNRLSLLAAVLGDRPTFGVIPEEVETDAPLIRTKALASGERWTLGPLSLRNRWHERHFFQWTTETGGLTTLTPENNHVVYTAPSTGIAVSDQLILWRTTEDGSTRQIIVNITVSPGAMPVQATDQLSASYNSGVGNFTANYTVDSAVTRAVILASSDGSSFNQVGVIDPVTSANRTGARAVAVAGSGAVNVVYFKLRVQRGTATAEDGAAVTVNYQPPPPAAKSAELPTAPNLIINGNEVGASQVQLFWGRVNDRYYRDNVNYYEVQQATNVDFTGAGAPVNVGNTAAGQNLYENVLYTATGLIDNTTAYFRVRAVNNVGAGPWSNVDFIQVNIQDRPVIAASPVFPANGATGVSKTPALEVSVIDADGDPTYTAFELSESPTFASVIRYFGHGGQQEYLNVTRLDPSEWGTSPLKPNTHYYWRAIVNEQGRFLDYYGGTWPTSPIYEFTTENVGGAYILSNVTYISGTLRPYERVTYRVTVTNNGNERSEPNNINVWYVKNGVDNPFAFNAPGYVPALDPGQGTTTDVIAYFTTSPFTSQNGITYDNILTTGASALRFKSSPYALATPQASVDFQINYANQGGPVVIWEVRGVSGTGSQSSKPAAPLGGKFRFNTSINDDIRTARVSFEYRINAIAPWILLDDYTGNTTTYANFQTMSHAGTTVPFTQNSIDWTFPANFNPTSTLQVKMTAYDDVAATTVVVSEPLTIYDGTLTVIAGATEFSAYRVGDQIRFPLSVIKAPGMRITNVNVTYWYAASSATRVLDVLWNNGVTTLVNDAGPIPFDPIWAGADGISAPPVISVAIPRNLGYSTSTGYLKIRVQGQIDGLASPSVEDLTDGTFIVGAPDIPAPFHQFITVLAPQDPAWPSGSLFHSSEVVPTTIDWQGDSIIHGLYKHNYTYYINETQNGNTLAVSHTLTNNYYARYDRTDGSVIQTLLPAGYEYDDLKVMGSTAYLLLRNGTAVSMAAMAGATMGTPQSVLTMAAQASDSTTPEFVRAGSELYLASSTRNDAGGGGNTTWRSRIQRVLPSALPFVEQPAYYGRHLNYGAFLSTDDGLYSLTATKAVAAQVTPWPYIGPVWFASSNSAIAGARAGYDSGFGIVDLYSPTGLATRWNAKIQDLGVTAFSDVVFAIGLGVSSGPVGEDGHRVVIRRNIATGAEERVHYADVSFYGSGRNTSVSAGKWVAMASRERLVVGNMSGDITAPLVQITTADASFTTGQSKSLDWTMSDNLNQLSSVKVLKIAGGVTTQIGSFTSGTLPTTLNYTFSDALPSLIVRVEAYDQSGNRGVSEKVLTRSSAFTLSSFTATNYSVPVATAAQLQWVATPVDAFRVYNILIRTQGTTAWTSAGTVTGASYLLDTTLLSGTQEVRLESGGVTRDLPQPIVITGNRFAFDNANFSPAGGVYVASASPLLRLNWASNQAASADVTYTVLARWNGAGSYVVLGGTTEKSLEVNVGSNTSLEWKVAARWQGLEFVSVVKTASLLIVGAGPTPVVTTGGRATASPWVDIFWSAVPGADALAVFRQNMRTNQVEELARVTGSSYRDEGVVFGDSFSYTLATVLGQTVSPQGTAASVTVSPLLPQGIVFVNAPYALAAENSNTVRWNPALPAGEASVFEDYQVLLRRGDGAIVATESVRPAAGMVAQVAYSGLEYNRSYVVEVFALHPNGTRLGTEPARLYFSTGFDGRVITGGPRVLKPVFTAYGAELSWDVVANTDYYDIFRKTNGGTLAWVGRSETTGFLDATAPTKAKVSYVVRARNANTFVDSKPTANSVVNVFATLAGSYTGPVTSQPSAFLLTGIASVNVNGSGAFTAKIGLGKKKYSLKGAFDDEGAFSGSLARRGLSPLGVALSLDIANGTDSLTGELTEGATAMVVDAWRGVNYTRSNLAPEGLYTFAIEPGGEAGVPLGYGVGTVQVSRTGGVKLKGTLANGTKLIAGSEITTDGRVPVYVVLDKGVSSFSAPLVFANKADSDLDGTALWFSGRESSAKYPFVPFTSEPRLFAQRYTPPARGERALSSLNATNGAATLTLGAHTQALTLGTDNRLTFGNPLLEGFSMKLKPKMGEFSGALLLDGERVKFGGVLLEKSGAGVGALPDAAVRLGR